MILHSLHHLWLMLPETNAIVFNVYYYHHTNLHKTFVFTYIVMISFGKCFYIWPFMGKSPRWPGKRAYLLRPSLHKKPVCCSDGHKNSSKWSKSDTIATRNVDFM